MPLTINSNVSSLNAQGRLAKSSAELGRSVERLSSGLRINRASDDASGLAVASLLAVDKRVYGQAVRNLNDAVSFLSVAESALGQLSNIVIRQRELAAQASNGALTGQQRVALNTEAQALAQEYQRIVDSTSFNNRKLLDGTTTSVSFQAGYGSNGTVSADIIRQTSQTVVTGLGSYTNHVGNYGQQDAGHFVDTRLLVADFTLDGIDDIVAIKGRANGTAFEVDIGLFAGVADGATFDAAPLAENSWRFELGKSLVYAELMADIADADGDGDLDIRLMAIVETVSFATDLYVAALNTASGGSEGFKFEDIGVSPDGDATSETVVGDFNDDGIEDQASGSGLTVDIGIQNTLSSLSILPELLTQESFNLLSQSSAQSAMEQFKENLDLLGSAAGRIGASQSRLGSANSVLRTTQENFTTAESRIIDADIASEAALLVRGQLLQQASAAILAQANQQPALVLKLLALD